MKRFVDPKMSLIYLSSEDLITQSDCPPHVCSGYTCDVCEMECNGTFTCRMVVCASYVIQA